jgi:hypothetical protein
MPGVRCTRGRVCNKKHTRQQPQVHRISRHSLRDGFNGVLRALVSAKSARMCERAVLTNRPSLELSPFMLEGRRACREARDRSGVFLNPNSCMGFEPGPSKEGSG